MNVALRRHWPAILLGLIVLLGAAVRLFQLSSVPVELTFDEVDLYNSARSYVTTGHDVDGSRLPFVFAITTRTPPMYAVAGYASTLAFGKTPLGLRLPAVAFGLASILLIFGIARRLCGRTDIALIAALLMATQPIFIQFSRIGWEPASELPFLLGGLYALVAAKSFRGLALASLLLALTSYTYLAGWFYALALGGSFVVLNFKRYRDAGAWAGVLGAAGIWLLLSLPALWMSFFDPLTSGRSLHLSTFAAGVTPESVRVFALNYLAHFRWSYLTQTGDPQPGITWRYLNGFGAFYGFVIPLAALGILGALKYARERAMGFWLWAWLVIYPLGGALTNQGAPNASRTLAGAPAFCILAAVGFATCADWIPSLPLLRKLRFLRVAMYAALATACLASLGLFCVNYFVAYPHRNANAWDSGTRDTFTQVVALSRNYDRVCFSLFPAFYALDSYARFYLEDVPLIEIDGIYDRRCFMKRTLIVVDTDHPLSRAGFKKLAETFDVNWTPYALIYGRSGPLPRAVPVLQRE